MRRICLTGHIMMGGSSWGFIFLFLFRVSSSLSLDADLSCKVALGQKRSVADDRGEPNEGPCDRKLVTMIGPPGSDVAAGAAGEFQAGGWGGLSRVCMSFIPFATKAIAGAAVAGTCGGATFDSQSCTDCDRCTS